MRTVGNVLSRMGNWLLDLAVRLEYRDWPPSAEFPRIDTSDRPFGLPPDCEQMEPRA